MRRSIMYLYLVVVFLALFVGCSKSSEEDSEKQLHSHIRKLAYDSLDENSKDTIIKWKTADVEEYNDLEEHKIAGNKQTMDIKGVNTFRVIFKTTQDAFLGPIVVYLDQQNYNILGQEVRN